MPLGAALDLTLIGATEPAASTEQCFPAWIVARLNGDVAITELPRDGTILALLNQRERIVACLQNTATVPQEELDRYSVSLGSVLLHDRIGTLYSNARRRGVRVNLLINDCELQRVPWEYMCGPDEQPTPHPARAISRIVACRVPKIGRKAPKSLLRVQLVVSREAGDTKVPLEEMTKRLTQQFAVRMPGGGVHLAVTAVSSRAAFNSALREPWDIVHFLGHGEVREQEGQPVGGLRLVDDQGIVEFFNARRFIASLTHPSPRLVLLTACNSAEPSVAAPFSNMARALVKGGVPAVVANQMAIPADTVAEFCGGLYDQLLNGGDIDESVNAGRLRSHATLARGDETAASVEWGIPVLHRAPGVKRLFPEF